MCSSLTSVNVCQPFTGIQHVCPRYIFSFIAVYAQIYIYLVAILLAVKARFCMFLFLDFKRKRNLKYAFKTLTFVLYDLVTVQLFVVYGFQGYLLSSVCSDLAPQFCLVQVIILVSNQIKSVFNWFVKLMLSHPLRHNTFNKLTFCSLKSNMYLA